jgi:hypothetical protein
MLTYFQEANTDEVDYLIYIYIYQHGLFLSLVFFSFKIVVFQKTMPLQEFCPSP